MLAENPYIPPFSRGEFARRQAMVQAAMRERGLDCLVIFGGDRSAGTDVGQPNAVYLSNYAPLSASYVVVPASGAPTLVMRHHFHLPNAKEIGALEDARASEEVEHGVADRLKELGVERGRIGLVGSGVTFPNWSIPHEHFQHLQATLPGATFENVSGWYEDLRLLKSEEELALMERAGDLTSFAYEELLLSTKPGARHADLRRVVEYAAFRLGGNYSFILIGSTSMDQPDMPFPSAVPTYRTVEQGHVVLTEIPIGLGNYSAKIMGTYFVGQPNDLYRRLFEAAAETYERTVEGLKPGMQGRDVRQFLRPIQEAGFVTHGPLIMGWSTYNERPRVGVLNTAQSSMPEPAADLDLVFRPGHCIYVTGRAATPDLRARVWIGASCVFTGTSLRMLVKHPISQMRVV
ncbi:MAG: aminopeptidase P family protein [Chloroflexi bacterium]|nr:aminopeptidase P family protein [Chloroflexota bacterium]